MKPAILAALALAAVAALGACDSNPAPAPTADPSAGLTTSDARLFLAPVKGNPAAVYFGIRNDSGKDWMISDAALDGSKSTMLHTVGGAGNNGGMGMVVQVPIKQGDTVKFEPGKLHVMVMDPPASLAPGDKTKLTLRFAGGDTFSFPVEVRAAGDER